MKIHWPLVIIDFLIIVAFGYGGIKFHYAGSAFVAEIVRVILPFLFGFLIAGLFLKAYELPKSGATFFGRSLGVWLAGMAVGLALRGFQRGIMPDTLFIGIGLAFTGVFLLLGRGGYWGFRGRHLSS